MCFSGACLQGLAISTGLTSKMAVNGKIKLASKDGEEFWMDIKAAMLSKTIEDMLKYTDENDTEAAPLRKVDSAIWRKVIEWCEHHKVRIQKKPNYLIRPGWKA